RRSGARVPWCWRNMGRLPAENLEAQMTTTVAMGMLGAGFIGQMHSLTFGSAGYSKLEPRLSGRLMMLAETDPKLAARVQQRYGWEAIADDWRGIVNNPEIEVFINSGPNDAHVEPTIAA